MQTDIIPMGAFVSSSYMCESLEFFSFTQNFPVLCSIFLEAVNRLILSAVSRYDARLLSISKSVLGERLIVVGIKNGASGCLKGVPP